MTLWKYAFRLLLLAGVAGALADNSSQPVQVPKGSPPAVDGKISADEWRDAARQELIGGGELRLKHDGAHLYVGIRGLKPGWSHVYVTDGDAVHVLHASAALGTAIYRQGASGAWQPIQSFTWAMRGTSHTEEAIAAFLEANGWYANNNRMGNPTEFEFKITRRFLKGDTPRLTVAFAADAKSPQYWPATISDDCLKQELLFGKTPPDLKFNMASWAKLKL